MRIFNIFRKNTRSNETRTFSIEIYEPIFNRIQTSLLSSNIEEGGKFLGKIYEDRNQITIKIYSYIDAGPNVSNSQTHIIPDGEHQERLFRVIESYDPNIEHIGSWHSHHCNGYQDLSNGDIEGYYHNVNSRDYNLDWFFVMLITSVKKQNMEAKYYLFHRGDNEIYNIDEKKISVIRQEYRNENILREVEQSTYAYRNQRQHFSHPSPEREQTRNWEETMMNIRAEDRAWIKNEFRSSRVFRNKKDDTINWGLIIPIQQDEFEVTYTYPKYSSNPEQAMLIITYRKKEILRTNIELNEYRFEKIISEINKAKEILYYQRN
jgi:hypothetical protein